MKDKTSSTVQAKAWRLAAIMFTDIVGFSRQMGADEARSSRCEFCLSHVSRVA
jgi:class 3 adenylate cyclase